MSLTLDKNLIYGLTPKLNALDTEDNNIKSRLGVIEGAGDGSIAKSFEDAKSYADNKKLDKNANLSDLADIALARQNLGVNSSAEVDDKIAQAKISLGTNYHAPDIAGRDAIENLGIGDVVMVTDDGDGKWAKYEVISVTDNTPEFVKIADQDGFEVTSDANSIKQSYESNDDTNAYTDADKATVGHITATVDVNLDELSNRVKANEELQHLDFANDDQVTINDGVATLSGTPLNAKVWGVMIINKDTNTIIAIPKGSDLAVSADKISGLDDYNGNDIRVTYAFAK